MPAVLVYLDLDIVLRVGAIDGLLTVQAQISVFVNCASIADTTLELLVGDAINEAVDELGWRAGDHGVVPFYEYRLLMFNMGTW